MSQLSITAFTANVSSSHGRNSNTSTPYSTTLTPPFVHCCQASENGIECWRHAEVAYKTTAWLKFPSEMRYLCKMHYALLWRMVLANLEERVLEDSYAPYYDDQQDNQANAAYYDAVARGGQVA